MAHGFHGTSIEAIAKAAGGSRAVVYQYFEDKADIRSALIEACDTELLQHAQHLGPLSPDAAGLELMADWLQELSELYDRHTAVFLEFPAIGFDQGMPASPADAVSKRYLNTVARAVGAADVRGSASPESTALALLRIVHMVNVYRSRGMFELDSSPTVSRSLAVAMQLMLFPDTPTGVAEYQFEIPAGVPLSSPVPTIDPNAAEVSPIRQDVLSAASTLFSQRGFHDVSMADIAVTAGVGRATVYRHFASKLALLEELSEWATLEGVRLADELLVLGVDGIQRNTLLGWLGRYARFHRNYGGVIRAWHDGDTVQMLPDDPTGYGQKPFHDAAMAVVGRVRLPDELSNEVAAAVFLAVLGRLSETAISRHPNVSDYGIAELLVQVLERALFSREWRVEQG
ncbi:TetR/AcrR family transcriptional regulator [Mycobacterium sp. SMC-8]|nr:TetR/AcrR family transcriptional regulator [Mycobacterium sp. SMC-8]UXA11561.1 TetR/AcrR family transcriptional regulator [Mycobacterium sp. SMC-8]